MAATLLAGCAAHARQTVRFSSITPGAPLPSRPRWCGRPAPARSRRWCSSTAARASRLSPSAGRAGSPSAATWPWWWTASGRGASRETAGSGPDDPPITARFDDAFGALLYLQSRPDVRADRVAAIGWSQGGVYAMAVINGPSLDRARQRGVAMPTIGSTTGGFAAGIGVYPGGCFSLVNEQVVRPLLVLIGEADDWTPATKCREMVGGDARPRRRRHHRHVSGRLSLLRRGGAAARGAGAGGERQPCGRLRRHRVLQGGGRRGRPPPGRGVPGAAPAPTRSPPRVATLPGRAC